MNIEVCIKKENDSNCYYSLQEITVSPRSYRLPPVTRDLMQFTSLFQSSFVIEIDIDTDNKNVFLKTLSNRLQISFSGKPADIRQVIELAKNISRVLPKLIDADKEGMLETKIEELFFNQFLFPDDEPGSALVF